MEMKPWLVNIKCETILVSWFNGTLPSTEATVFDVMHVCRQKTGKVGKINKYIASKCPGSVAQNTTNDEYYHSELEVRP